MSTLENKWFYHALKGITPSLIMTDAAIDAISYTAAVSMAALCIAVVICIIIALKAGMRTYRSVTKAYYDRYHHHPPRQPATPRATTTTTAVVGTTGSASSFGAKDTMTIVWGTDNSYVHMSHPVTAHLLLHPHLLDMSCVALYNSLLSARKDEWIMLPNAVIELCMLSILGADYLH